MHVDRPIFLRKSILLNLLLKLWLVDYSRVALKQANSCELQKVAQFQFNFIRMMALGSDDLLSSKEMEPSQKLISGKLGTLNSQPSQNSPTMHPSKSWKICLNSHKHSLNEWKPKTPQQSTTFENPTVKWMPTSQLSQDKIKEVKSLLNYLSPSERSGPYISKHQIQSLFMFMATMFNASPHIFQKIKNLPQPKKTQKEVEETYPKSCRNKLALCFSNKWRELQPIIYLLIQSFESTNKQSPTCRVHIINQRGLILQTLANFDQNTQTEDIIYILSKHYSKLQTLVIIHPNNENVNLDTLENFIKQFEGVNIIMTCLKTREINEYLQQQQSQEIYQNPLAPNIFLHTAPNGTLLLWSNKHCKENIRHHLQLVSSLLERESMLASFFKLGSYFSSIFNQKQILLRLFAFYFNYITINSMLPSSKDELLSSVIDSQVQQFKIKENQQQKNAKKEKGHIFNTHTSLLCCQICKKRTKTKCQKCCLDFNRYFGLCEKQCFPHFHQHMNEYILSLKKNKNIINPLDSSEEQENQLQDSSIQGRKMLKKEESANIETPPESELQRFAEIKKKWIAAKEQEEEVYSQFKRYSSMLMISPLVMSKINFLRTEIDKLKASSQSEQPPPSLKKQEH